MATNQLNTVIRYLHRAVLLREGGGLTDGQLLERFLTRRDETAFEALLRRHGPMVLGVCRRVLGNAHDAEDAFQATFLVLVRKAASLRSGELVGNWLYGVAYRTALAAKGAITRRRSKERQVHKMPEPEALAEQTWQELRPLLDRELSRLPDKYRAAIILCDLEGRTRKEAARQLKLPEGTLSGRLTIARRILARRLAGYGLTLSAGSLAVLLSQNGASAGVPMPLLLSTAKAAALLAAGQTATAGLISAKVAALTEGVLKTMLLTKLKMATAVLLLAAGALGLCVGVATLPALQADPLPAGEGATPEIAALEQKEEQEAEKAKEPEKKDAEKAGEIRRFEGHEGEVWCVTFSPKGDQAVSCGEDGTIRLWKVATGEQVALLEGHQGQVWSAVFSPDGRRLLSGGEDKTVRLWDVETGKELRQFDGHTEPVRRVAFSPKGDQALSGGYDGIMRLWDVKTGNEVRRFEHYWINTVAFSPDGKQALSSSNDKTVRLWDVASGQEVGRCEGHAERVWIAAYSPDGQQVLSGGTGENLLLWDTKTGKELRRFEGEPLWPDSLAFSPDGRRAVSNGTNDGKFFLWDVGSGKLLLTLGGHDSRVNSVAYSPDGRYALTGSSDKTVRLWRLPPPEKVAPAPEPEKKKEDKPGQVRRFEGNKDFFYAAVFSPDGRQVLSGGGGQFRNGEWTPGEQDYRVWLWDVASGQLVRHFEGHTATITGVAFSRDGSQALSSSYDGNLRLWEVKTGNSLGIYEVNSPIYGSALSPDGKRALAGCGDGSVRLWDLDGGKELRNLADHGQLVWAVAFSPDGKLALSGSEDNTIRLWDLDSGQEVRKLEGHTDLIRRLAFTPDGKRAVSVSRDKTVRLWEVETAKELRKMEGHTDDVQGMALTADGRRILSCSFDATLRIWDAETGQELATLRQDDGARLEFVGVSPDGRYAVTTGWDEAARLWRLPEAAKAEPASARE